MIGDAPDRRVEILADHDSLNATWSRFGPGRDGADLHVHREHTDLFYVLEGEFTLRLGPQGERGRMTAGTLIRMPPGVVHGFRNASDAELRFLNFHAPGVGFADYMRDLRDGRAAAYDQWDPPEDGGRPISLAGFGDRVDVPAIKLFPAETEPGAPESHRTPATRTSTCSRATLGQRRAGARGRRVGARAAGRAAHAGGRRALPRDPHAGLSVSRAGPA